MVSSTRHFPAKDLPAAVWITHGVRQQVFMVECVYIIMNVTLEIATITSGSKDSKNHVPFSLPPERDFLPGLPLRQKLHQLSTLASIITRALFLHLRTVSVYDQIE